jgi:hypothetical protein
MTNTQLEAEIEHLLALISELREEINDLTEKVNMLSILPPKGVKFEHIGRWEN